MWWKGCRCFPLQWLHHLAHRGFKKSLEGRLPSVQLEGVLNHRLNALIAPVLVLLEIANETGTGDTGKPSGHHALDAPADEQRW